jgi:hypothetical protein
MKTLRLLLAGALAGSLSACSSSEDDDDLVPAGLCDRYCDTLMAACGGDNAQFADLDTCVSYCDGTGWPEGRVGDTSGNTIECRIYHAEVAAMEHPEFHCPHAGPTGDNVCGSVGFRRDAPDSYTRVDRMGMPAVSTALIRSARKNAYNDADPRDDAALEFLGDLAESLAGLHDALDSQLQGLGLTPCSMDDPGGGSLPECVAQEVAPGVSVASLVVPDTLKVDPGSPSGFPNGRTPPDQVIDVTLAVILLRMGGACGTGTCSPATLAALPLNPRRNDVGDGSFPETFPYLHPPHAP